MKDWINQTRLFLAEKMLDWASYIAPKGTKERREINTFLRDYFSRRIAEFEAQYPSLKKPS